MCFSRRYRNFIVLCFLILIGGCNDEERRIYIESLSVENDMPLSSPIVISATSVNVVDLNIAANGDITALNNVSGNPNILSVDNGGLVINDSGTFLLRLETLIPFKKSINGLVLPNLQPQDNILLDLTARMFIDSAKTSIINDEGRTQHKSAQVINIINDGVNSADLYVQQTPIDYYYSLVSGNTLFINTIFSDTTGLHSIPSGIGVNLSLTKLN